MRRMLLLICALAVSSTAHAGYVSKLFGCSEKEPLCVVRYNEGGEVSDFIKALLEIHTHKIKLMIDGECRSSCAMVADLLRRSNRVCVTPRASFHFHQGTYEEKITIHGVVYLKPTGEHFILQGTREILGWNEEKGGYPIEGYNVMSFPETLEYWKLCPGVSLPRLEPPSLIPLPPERPIMWAPGIEAHGLY